MFNSNMRLRLASLLAFFVWVITPALADWNGTWAGNWGGAERDGVQIIMAGNDVIAIYWHGDYLQDDMKSVVSPDRKVLSITWKDGAAILTRDGASTAKFQIHDLTGSATGELRREQ